MPIWMALEGGAYDVVIRQEVAIVVWSLVAIGGMLGFLPRTQPSLRAWLPVFAIGALVGFNVLSLLWTSSAERTVDEVARVILYAGVVVLALCSVNRFTWRAAAGGLSAAIGVIAVVAVLSRLFPGAFPVSDVQTDRLFYPFGYWNAVACWAAMAIASGLSWSAHARTGVVRGLALASVPVAAVAVYLTYSRGGVVAAGIAVAVAVALARHRWTVGIHSAIAAAGSTVAVLAVRAQPEIADGIGGAGGVTVLVVLIGIGIACAAASLASRAAGADRMRLPVQATILALVAGAVVLVGGLFAGSEQISDAVDDFKEGGSPASVQGDDPTSRLSSAGGSRYDYWDVAVDALGSAPLGGIGPGTYEFYWSEHGPSREFVVDAHSLYLEQLAELGLAGFLVLGGFLAALIGAAVAARRSRELTDGAEVAMFAIFVVWLAYAGFDWIWEMPAITAVALAAVAVAVGGGSARRHHRPAAPLRLSIVAAGLLAIAIQTPGIVSNERARAAETARLAGDPEAATALAAEAIDAAPWAATPRHVRALAALDADQLERAEAAIRDAIEREDRNRWHWLLAAQIAIARADAGAARERLDEAIRLNGKLPLLNRFSPVRVELEAQTDALSAPR